MSVPVIDFKDFNVPSKRDDIIKELCAGLKDVGFIVLKNHPIDSSLIKKAYDEVEKFFLKDKAYKESFKNKEILQSGYIPFGIEKAKDSDKYDLKEFWQVVNDFNNPNAPVKNVWTDNEEYNNTLKSLYHEMYKLSEVLLGALGEGIQMDKSYLQEITANMNSVLRIIHYPPLKEEEAKKGHVRASAHEDINLITIMPGASETGLEILDKDGKWLAIEANYNYLIVDSGDMLSRITNDIYSATTHRVVNPSDSNKRRFSMPFFCHPNPEATLRCVESCKQDGEKYPPINANELLNKRLEEINLKKN